MSQQFMAIGESGEDDRHNGPVWGLKWTPNDQCISISADGSFALWEPPTSRVLRRSKPDADSLALISVSCPTGNLALYNSIVGVTSLINLESGVVAGKKSEYKDGTDFAWSVSLHPDERTYAAVGLKGIINLYSAEPASFGQYQQSIEPEKNAFGMCVSYSPDGKRIAMSTKNGQIVLCDPVHEEVLCTFSSHVACARTVSWSADGQSLLSGADDSRLVFHDVRKKGGAAFDLSGPSGHKSWILSADLSSDSKLAASGSADQTLKIWDLRTRSCVSTTQQSGEVWSVAWRPQGGQLVTGGNDGDVRWWRSASSSS